MSQKNTPIPEHLKPTAAIFDAAGVSTPAARAAAVEAEGAALNAAPAGEIGEPASPPRWTDRPAFPQHLREHPVALQAIPALSDDARHLNEAMALVNEKRAAGVEEAMAMVRTGARIRPLPKAIADLLVVEPELLRQKSEAEARVRQIEADLAAAQGRAQSILMGVEERRANVIGLRAIGEMLAGRRSRIEKAHEDIRQRLRKKLFSMNAPVAGFLDDFGHSMISLEVLLREIEDVIDENNAALAAAEADLVAYQEKHAAELQPAA